jgi:hypothetical protein
MADDQAPKSALSLVRLALEPGVYRAFGSLALNR